jgi:hypothetical protein
MLISILLHESALLLDPNPLGCGHIRMSITQLNIKDFTLPLAGILFGSPSPLKTVGIDLFRK